MAIQENDFLSNSLSGAIVVGAGQIVYEDTVLPIDFEGQKTFNINFRKFNVNGPVIFTTDTITLNDTANLTAIVSNTSLLNEGDLVTFNIATSGVASSNLTLYYSTLGNVTYNDFVGGNIGSFDLVNGAGSITLQSNADNSSGIESDEQFQLQIRRTGTSGAVLGTSANIVIIRDTSNVITLQSISLSSNSIVETESITISITSLNALGNAGSTLYYTVTGNADLYGGASGSIVVNDNSANIELIAEGTVPDGEERNFALQFRSGSVSGTILDTTDNITVSSYLPSGNATGGSVTTSGDYRIHTFTSSANLNVTTSFPPTSKVEVLLIGGGGAGSGGGSISSGGGSGGALYGNLALGIGDNLVSIGAGGTTGGSPLGNPGANTSFMGYIALGGGGGVAWQTGLPGTVGQTGGSGGGGQGNRSGLVEGGLSLQTPQGDLTGYGNKGGNSAVALGDPIGAGGGGGIGTAGIDATPALSGGGGRGLYFTISGANVGYGGGGVGFNYNYGNPGSPAYVWGGGDYTNSVNGVNNTGGGGAGSGFIYGPNPGAGGSGVAIFRYRINQQINPRISYVSSVTANTNSIAANDLVSFDVSLVNAQNGETLYYDTVGDITNFLSSNTGSTAVTANSAVVTLRPNYITNAGNVKLRIRRNSITGTILNSSDNVLVEPNFEVLSAIAQSANSINQTESVTFTLSSLYGDTGSTTFYYTVEGNAAIYSSNTGTANVGGTPILVLTDRDVSVPDNTDTYFNVKIRSGNSSGIVLLTSEDVYVNSGTASLYNLGLLATGGVITTSGDYTTHAYNTSSTLTVTNPGVANVLVVGGGGGGGSSNPVGWETGGGGAGGIVYATTYTLPATSYTITIGAGGAGDNNGANTELSSPSVYLIGLGGGAGGAGGEPGNRGGSGGGGAHQGPAESPALQPTWPGDSGTYGYGFPGRGGAPGYGAGGGGATEISPAPTRKGGNGLPVVMLTEGLTTYYGGGGGGSGAAGGLGGGGTGPGTAGAGRVNSGGGGGSSGYGPGNPGGPGGSGIVLVKYATSPATAQNPTVPMVTTVAANTNSIDGGDIVTFSISTLKATEGMTFYYDTVGNVNVDSFVGGNTGSFTVSSNTATLALTANITTVAKEFNLRVKRTASGPVLKVSDSVTIAEIPIVGGTFIIDETYSTHVFTTSGNLVVSSSLNSPIQANVLIIGGGGGSTQTYPAPPVPAISQRIWGGGGAGGFLEKEVTLDPANTYSIIVGAGLWGSGNPSEAFGNVAYGGGGTNGQGGSGGAPWQYVYSMPSPPPRAGIQPTYGGYGYPSGSNPPGTTLGSAGGGGAGGTATGLYMATGGIGRVSLLSPPAYGTPGPTPGRWFAGGGSGWSPQPNSAAAGGGGLNGPPSANQPVPVRYGAENTGGGGSGTHVPLQQTGGSGGSGIVIIRYSNG